MAEGTLNIAGKKIPYKTLAIGALAAGALFILTRGSGGGGGSGQVPVFPLGQTGVGGDTNFDSIQKQLSDLNTYYNDLLSKGDANTNKIVDLSPIQYQIQPGDTPKSIAQKFGITRRDINHFNKWVTWDNWNKYVGRFLWLPHNAASA